MTATVHTLPLRPMIIMDRADAEKQALALAELHGVIFTLCPVRTGDGGGWQVLPAIYATDGTTTLWARVES